MSATLLRLDNIVKSFGAVRALKGVSFDLQPGEVHALVGENGAAIHPETEVRHLSMPEQQLVEIARALGAGARILIMDEPTASLTAREVDLLLNLVKNLRSEAVAIIYISHRLEEVFQIADRVT